VPDAEQRTQRHDHRAGAQQFHRRADEQKPAGVLSPRGAEDHPEGAGRRRGCRRRRRRIQKQDPGAESGR